MNSRINKIFDFTSDVDVIIIKNGVDPFIDPNFYYITGLYHGLFEGCIAVLYSDGRVDLYVSSLEAEIANESGYDIAIYKDQRELKELIKRDIKESSIGVNYSTLLYRDYKFISSIFPDARLIDVSSAFIKARMIKEKEEIENIRKACEIADEVMKTIPDIVERGISEDELAAEIVYRLLKKGASEPAFTPIISFGERTSKPHYTHSSNRLKENDFILCDFGARYNGYCSDMTRTFVYGTASDKQRNMYTTVFEAQRIGFKEIKPGIPASQVDKVVREFIDSTIFSDGFIHATGHAIGLSVHDDGVGFNSNCNEILQENMVLTVEPGIYIPGFGGVRIEDDILITKDGLELLTNSPRELIEI
ncbi:MAG: aminopeptidase P family protein [Thermoplasmata archaeon]|nr:MAG: aminopeptidase P family protein [Thermoplasmata archaeon]